VIPQDPTLFAGSLKFNLDPFDRVDEKRIEELLHKAGLKDLLNRSENAEASERGINMVISEGGKNLSSGERQLICICRAILRTNRIVILDEATANIDVVTEQKI
jgi:ABC-type multidrug transport system fused ATPase/permease subunit